MVTIETHYTCHIEFNYDQEKVERDDFDRLEQEEEAGLKLSPPRDVIEEIEALVGEAVKDLDLEEANVHNGGPAWLPFVELKGPIAEHVRTAAERIKRIIRMHDYAELT